MSHHDDRDPDQRALDELSRAFADESDDPDEGGARINPPSPPAADPDRGAPPAAGNPDPDRPVIRIGEGWDDDLEPTAPTPVPSYLAPVESDPIGSQGPDGPDNRTGSGGGGVISIDDADLPDAVYVEGSLDRDSSAPVVIVDDDTGDSLKPESERDLRRGIEPRMRERRRAVKRAAGRRRLVWFGAIVGLLVVAVAVLAILGSSWFSVDPDKVLVSGARYTDPAEIDQVIDQLAESPSLLVDVAEIEADLEALPWVERAEVDIDFPDSATIEIAERTPLATYRAPDGRYRILDREGRVVDIIDGYPIEFVWITSPDPVDLDLAEFAPAGYAAASELVKNLTPTVRSRIDRVDVTADGSTLRMYLDDGTVAHFGAANELFDKLVRLETLLTEYPELSGADLDISTAETTRASRPTSASPEGNDDDS